MAYKTPNFSYFRFTRILDRFRTATRKRRLRVLTYEQAAKFIPQDYERPVHPTTAKPDVRVAVSLRSLIRLSGDTGMRIHHPLCGDPYCEVAKVWFYAPNLGIEYLPGDLS